VVVGRLAVVCVEDVDDGVAHADDAELSAHDIDAEALEGERGVSVSETVHCIEVKQCRQVHTSRGR
jgi:hypothetical protein